MALQTGTGPKDSGGYEPVSLRDSVDEWIKREDCEKGEEVLVDLYYRGTEQIEGDYGPYNGHFFSDDDGKIYGMGGCTSIDDQIQKGINMGTIVKKKTKIKIDYVGQVAKKGKTEINEKSFKKYAVRMNNSHWMVEETPVAPKNTEAPEMDATEDIPF